MQGDSPETPVPRRVLVDLSRSRPTQPAPLEIRLLRLVVEELEANDDVAGMAMGGQSKVAGRLLDRVHFVISPCETLDAKISSQTVLTTGADAEFLDHMGDLLETRGVFWSLEESVVQVGEEGCNFLLLRVFLQIPTRKREGKGGRGERKECAVEQRVERVVRCSRR